MNVECVMGSASFMHVCMSCRVVLFERDYAVACRVRPVVQRRSFDLGFLQYKIDKEKA